MQGRVIRVDGDRFAVDIGESVVTVKSRKKVKRADIPLAGDTVLLEGAGEYVLTEILPRTCCLIRPPIANIDQIVVTLAPLPQPDFLTVDKMLLYAHRMGIETVLCVNKTDITPPDFFEDVKSQYEGVADAVVSACAATGQIDALKERLRGKFTCFAGQSAVGKTSLVNAVCRLSRTVGHLSEKTLRGKNTTTRVELIKTDENTYIADTPGFGALRLFDMRPEELALYYDEYVAYADACKYRVCTHTTEPDCAVRAAVQNGALSRARYERYNRLFAELRKENKLSFGRNTYAEK